MSRYNRHQDSTHGLWAGVVVLCIGLFFFLDRMNLNMPDWVISWPMLLIVIGFGMALKRKFQGAGWFIMILVGSVFLVNRIVPFTWDFHRFMWPSIIIIIGIALIGKAGTRKQRYDNYVQEGSTSNDLLESTVIFSGTNKVVLSKDFKGGNVTTVFGSTELNFVQADINGEAILNVETVFGGVEITVPASWDVRMDVNTIFGGVEDKRSVPPMANSGKVLIIRGSCVFGGVDLKSF
ncbi:hypothetical protein GFS24_18865 [Chitinophaga sp. SYP-B3965]|uniref:LiaF transmembrane domain-containing protein n=1 Tax=Chitinophaga sp. SYP-B3965 TaxID=2663120 RepID=UPI00129955C9|nr:DUF5668 domain-containing protein [Chitinophaga sp. SYP-B3965]MRG47191.1 hypothetical protein [Chitinophaga sp. SYP-B3965]